MMAASDLMDAKTKGKRGRGYVPRPRLKHVRCCKDQKGFQVDAGVNFR